MGRAYTSSGISINFGGTAVPTQHLRVSSGTTTIVDSTDTTRLVSPPDDLIYMRELVLGGTAQAALGTPDAFLYIWDSSGKKYFEADVDVGLKINNKRLELNGTNTPNAGTGNSCKLYLDTSGGKTRLMALFESGTAVAVVVEP